MVKKFEDTNVLYMINQARMPFFQVSTYPLYKIEDGRLVVDDSEYTKNLKAECRKIADLMRNMIDREKKNAGIPKTWKNQVIQQESLVMALKAGGSICDEWFNEYNRLLRYFKG